MLSTLLSKMLLEVFIEQNYIIKLGQVATKVMLFLNAFWKLLVWKEKLSGAKGIWTPDPLHAMQVLYQLSYGPKSRNVIHINQSKDFYRNVRNSYSTL